MNENQVEVNRAFFVEWLVVCTITSLAGGMLAFATMWTVGEIVTDALGEAAGFLVAGALFGLLFGGGISAGQGIVMRRTGISAGRWAGSGALAAAAGMGFGFAAISLLMNDLDTVPEPVIGLIMGLFLGLPLGLAQWRILRRHVPGAGLWPAVSFLAIMIALYIGLPLSGEGREFLALGTVGVLVAALSGIGMTWLLRRQTAVAV